MTRRRRLPGDNKCRHGGHLLHSSGSLFYDEALTKGTSPGIV